MKRFTLFLVLTALIVVPAMAERVSPETARKVATTFLNNNGAKSNQLVDLSKTAGFPNLYIFSTEESFVIMAADDCVKPILGYSLTGKFVAEGMPENIRGWLQGYSDEIQYAIENKTKATAETAQLWKDLVDGNSKAAKARTVVNNLLSTTWDQNPYYNMLCPYSNYYNERTVTGCVATAMAQIMKYWNHPIQGTDSHTYTHTDYTDSQGRYHDAMGVLSANFYETTYDWDNMPPYLSYSSSSEQNTAVATLMYHCGVSVEMDYGISDVGGSGAITADVADALYNYFSYSHGVFKSKADCEETWTSMLKAELDEHRPLQYSGRGSGGHSFVCCGYDDNNKFYFNWGWSGRNDGFYSLDNLAPGSGGAGGGNHIYTNNQGAIFGIEPINNSLAAPTLSATASNGIITLSWNEISDAETYDIYKDNVRIETGIVENSYIDNNVVPGTAYEYYVRAVSNSTRSNPSNRIIKHTFYRNYEPSELTATLTNNSVELTWLEPSNNSAILQYATNYIGRYGLGEGKDVYWAEVFSPARLTDFVGMYIEKVSVYLYMDGDYTLYIYQDNTNEVTNKLYEQSITISTQGWYDISLTTPVLLDYTKALWIVMYYPYTEGSSFNYWYPATCGSYDEIPFDDEENEERYNPRFLSESLLDFHHVTNDISWLFRTYLTDGTYTYNLYDGTNTVASNIDDTNYTINNIADNTAHQYTVKTNYYGGESAASNMAGLTVGNAPLSSLSMNANDKMTVTEGSTLTVSGDVINDNPDNLILENGAQLIHNSEDVQATVKKVIEPYTADDNGWYFIASPVLESFEPSKGNGFLNGTDEANTYDLYYYYEPTHLWKNYEAQAFNIEHKKGYLYANGETNGTTLKFTGTLMPSNTDVTISNLSYDATELKGFNLVGNPFACNAVVNKDYYIVNGNNVSIPETGHVIAPCESIFVQASENDASVTFTKAASAKGAGSKDCFDLVVTQGRANIDRARVRLNNGIGMEKFSLNDKNSQISLWQGGQDFAVAYTNGATEMPVSFLASKDGTYTLTLETGNFDLDYLHLIDNLTGNDVDLLVTPSYTFEAKYSDYPSRFKLVFASVCEDADSDNENFAFINNGNIIIGQKGTLQIVDMTGRMIYQGDAKHCVSTTGMPNGVYVLRLITTDGVKIQKIVVE